MNTRNASSSLLSARTLILFIAIFATNKIDSAFAQVSWTKLNTYFLDYPYVNCFLFDDRGVFWAGTGTALHHSTDNGNTWSRIPEMNGIHVSGLAMNAKGYLFAAGWREAGASSGIEGVWRSKDHGQSWQVVTSDWGTIRSFSVTVNRNGTIIAGGTWGYFLSTDDGDTWALSNGSFQPFDNTTYGNVNELLTVPGGALLSQVAQMGVARSENGGTRWHEVLDQSARIGSITCDSFGNCYAPFDSGVYRSIDSGRTWDKLYREDHDYYDLALTAANGWLFGIGSRVVLSTDRGITWSSMNSGITTYYNPSQAIVSPAGYVFYVQLTGALYRSTAPLQTSGVSPQEVPVSELTLTPNPCSGDCQISTHPNETIQSVSFADVTGRIVKTLTHPTVRIDTHDLQNGVYFVTIVSTDGRKVLPLTVER